jgi:hypothetical protein
VTFASRRRGKSGGKHIVIKKVTKTWCIQAGSSTTLPPTNRKRKTDQKLKVKVSLKSILLFILSLSNIASNLQFSFLVFPIIEKALFSLINVPGP